MTSGCSAAVAVSRDSEATGTTTSDLCLAGGSGIAQPGGAGRDQDDEDRLRAIGDRRQGVERQRGQPLDGGQPMSFVILGDGGRHTSQDVIRA